MQRLDFISGAPKSFIFQQESNKTNLGGLITILFFIAMIIIIYAYLHEYFVNDKYTVSYSYNMTFYPAEEQEENLENEELYPDLNFSIFIPNERIRNNTKVFTVNGKPISPDGESFTIMKMTDILLEIFFKCKNDSFCGVPEEEKTIEDRLNLYDFLFGFEGYYVDNQNPETPIKRDLNYEDFPFSINNNRINFHMFSWGIIEYTEESSLSGLFKSENITYGGFIAKNVRYDLDADKEFYKLIYNKETNKTEKYQLVSMVFFNQLNFGYYELYSRQRVSIFDSISDICSLIITLYGVVTFIFCGFYSNSFDNYKIIEKILLNKLKINFKKNESYVELTGDKNDVKDDIKDNLLNEKEKEKEDIIITNENTESNNLIIDDNKDINGSIDIKWKLPKFHFYDFFYNNIYTQKCCNSPTQEIISSCNDIITKYYSVDTVIYNQLKLENLFKDYKWNNPRLNNIENIELISQIKNLMNSK